MTGCPACDSYPVADDDRIEAAGAAHRNEMTRIRALEAAGKPVTVTHDSVAMVERVMRQEVADDEWSIYRDPVAFSL